MLNRISNLATKDIIQLTRDMLMLTFIILGPILELALLAHSTGQGITNLPVVIVDQDKSSTSRQIIAAINNTEELKVVGYLDSPGQIGAWLERSQALLAVILPINLEADLGKRALQIQLIADGTNSTTGSYAQSAATGAINSFVTRHVIANTGDLPLELYTQVRYNPTLNVRHLAITSQLGFIIYQVTLMVASLGLAREREMGTLEQLLVTPMQRLELIVGKAIPALIIAGIDFVLMWVITVQIFQVPMRGSFTLLLGLSLLFIAAEIGWGLTISALSHNQQQAVLLVFVLAMIDVSFSGYMVPIDRMPAGMQLISQLFPLQHYLVIIRQVMLRGVGLTFVWKEIAALIVLGAASNIIAAISLRRRLD